MPVFDVKESAIYGDAVPPWADLTAVGIFQVPRDGGRFDRHFHDYDEYWLIYRGRGRVMSEGVEYEVGPGSVVCTQAGQEHDVLVVDEDIEAFFFETGLPPGGTAGHLHRTPDLAEGHDVQTR
jgi:mannose-6-phosphate isomerase-like protein (cupin superfamily)